MISGSQLSDNTLGNDPLNPSAPPGQDTSVFNNTLNTLATDAAQVYKAINAPPSPTFQQVQTNSQVTILLVGGLILLAIIFWPK